MFTCSKILSVLSFSKEDKDMNVWDIEHTTQKPKSFMTCSVSDFLAWQVPFMAGQWHSKTWNTWSVLGNLCSVDSAVLHPKIRKEESSRWCDIHLAFSVTALRDTVSVQQEQLFWSYSTCNSVSQTWGSGNVLDHHLPHPINLQCSHTQRWGLHSCVVALL